MHKLRQRVLRTPALRTLFGGLGVLSVSLLTGSLVGCGSDVTSPSATTDPLWTLHLNQHAVQLALTAPQNTIQLTATPLTVGGHAPVGVGPVQYVAQDSTVTVNATGLVTAHALTFQNAKVVATVTDTVHHITSADTCFLQVTATAPNAPLSGFTLQSASGDTLPLGGGGDLIAVATDVDGNPFLTFVYFTSADPTMTGFVNTFAGGASLDGVGLTGRQIGQVLVYAETWAYGVAKRDSLLLTVGVPSAVTISVVPVMPTGSTHAVSTFWPQITTVATGAVVTWSNPSYTDSIDVVFDDPANVDSALYSQFNPSQIFSTGGGNIAPWVRDTTGLGPVAAHICSFFGDDPDRCRVRLQSNQTSSRRKRSFPVAGTYHYHSAKWGTSGTIVVQ